MDAGDWDARYAASELVWSAGPNTLAAQLLAPLRPGSAVDVAAGEGRMALWLASRGWRVRALDFSAVGLARGRERASAEGLDVDWVVADVTTADLGTADLVVVLYLHLPRPALAEVLARCAAAVAPGGRLLVLGHDRDNLVRGTGGPQDADLLYDLSLLRDAAGGLDVERCEQVERPTDHGTALDTLLWARRPDGSA